MVRSRGHGLPTTTAASGPFPEEDAGDTAEDEVEVLDEEDFGDPCHEFEHSILFFLLLTLSFLAVVTYCILLARRRLSLTGYDVLYLLLFSFAFIRFGPKVWGALQVHGIHPVSQTGCKLVAYTEFGLRHVNVFLVGCLLAYAWLAGKEHREDLDYKIRRHLPWLLLFLFALEGATGMFPAIYTDLDLSSTRCDFAHSDEMTLGQFLTGQILLSAVLPYVLPFLIMLYPMVVLTRRLVDMEEEPLRSTVRNILVVVWTHVMLSLPWALHALVMLPLLQGWTVGMDAITVCIIDGVFRLLLETWYVVTPVVIVLGDPVLGKDLPGQQLFCDVWEKVAAFARGRW